MRLVDAEVRKQIIEEVNNEIREHVTELFSNTARELIAQKLDLKPAGGTEKKKREIERKEPSTGADELKLKTALAEEILSLSRGDALEKLKLSLATGEIDENTYRELKSLVRPADNVCPHCGKKLEPTANFCRFCGSKITS